MQVVYQVEGQLTDIIPIGRVPNGIRIDVPFTGSIVSGVFEGGTVEGTNYLLLRPDGVGEEDVRGRITTPAGQLVGIEVDGYDLMPEGAELPPPDVLLSPDFTWPDIDVELHSFARYETTAEDLAWINRTVLAISGTANFGTRELSATAHAVWPLPQPAAG